MLKRWEKKIIFHPKIFGKWFVGNIYIFVRLFRKMCSVFAVSHHKLDAALLRTSTPCTFLPIAGAVISIISAALKLICECLLICFCRNALLGPFSLQQEKYKLTPRKLVNELIVHIIRNHTPYKVLLDWIPFEKTPMFCPFRCSQSSIFGFVKTWSAIWTGH